MKPILNCEIVHDLLPLYVDGLTAPGTNTALEEHLAGCARCRAAKAAMTEETGACDAGQKNQKEVDYLKRLRRRSRGKVFLAVVCTVLVLAGLLGAKLLWIGEEADREGISWAAGYDEEENLTLRVFDNNEAAAYRSWQLIRTEDGVLHITARRVRSSFLCNDREERFVIELDGVREIYLFGRLLWQQGALLFESTLDVYEKRTPYVGDAPAVGALLNKMKIGDDCGPFTIELETDAEPYGLILSFEAVHTPQQAKNVKEKMTDHAVKLLALVENLGRVSWRLPMEDGTVHRYEVSLQEPDALFRAELQRIVDTNGWAELGFLPPDESGSAQQAWEGQGLKWAAGSPHSYHLLETLLRKELLNTEPMFELNG